MMKKAYLILLVFGVNFLGFSAFLSEAEGSPSQVESITNVFYVRPELRNPHDQISRVGGKLLLSVAYDLPPNPNAELIECLGYRWLLGGRGQRLGAGAPEIYKRFRDIEEIELELYQLESKTKSQDGRGKLEKLLEKKVYSRFSVSPEPLREKNWSAEEWKAALWESPNRCLELGRELQVRKEIKW
jgi:hypothetical protein